MKNEDTHHGMIERLRGAGLRATSSRVAILDQLQGDRRHPTAEMVYASLHDEHPSLSLSTVYSTLESFIDKGLLRRVHTPDGLLRVDGTLADHDHAICRDCGKVHDIMRPGTRPDFEPELPPGVRLVAVNVEYEVLCSACAEHAASTTDGPVGVGENTNPAGSGHS